ncbi:Protein-serine/threonine phosphatase [Micromonospora noduli]|uniref:AAA family ATPase n=1 Tax=Micromonospora noduli TaxID=709876 RepID=UPI000DBFEF99|nr:AAA family ATPase [Micromonospora noduli]RAO26101.1 Protein-serine/threonine phosphatase [Micromonospora noduli]
MIVQGCDPPPAVGVLPAAVTEQAAAVHELWQETGRQRAKLAHAHVTDLAERAERAARAHAAVAVTADAVALLLAIVDARLSRWLTTVVDATNGVAAERAELLAAAGRHQVPAAAVVFSTPLETCLARQRHRPLALPGRRWGRAVPDSVVRNQHQRTLASLATLTAEGFAQVLTIGDAR